MAAIKPSALSLPGFGDRGQVVTWTPVTESDTCLPFENPGRSDRSVQVEGTFGGATITIEGSNDGTNWHTLHDGSGTALTFTSADLRQVLEVTRYIRAKTASGSGSSVTVTLLAVGQF